MAVLAVAHINALGWVSNTQYAAGIEYAGITDSEVYAQFYLPIDVETGLLGLQDAIKDAVKEHANTNFGVTFGLLDTVKLVALTGIL